MRAQLWLFERHHCGSRELLLLANTSLAVNYFKFTRSQGLRGRAIAMLSYHHRYNVSIIAKDAMLKLYIFLLLKFCHQILKNNNELRLV